MRLPKPRPQQPANDDADLDAFVASHATGAQPQPPDNGVSEDDVLDAFVAKHQSETAPPPPPNASADLSSMKANLEWEKANSPRSILGWLGNIPKSGLQLLTGGAEMIANPLDTLGAISDVAVGGMQKITTPLVRGGTVVGESKVPVFDAFLDQMKKRYGGLDAIGNTLYEDPAGAALDISGLLSGGSAAVASRLPRTAAFLASASRALDPISAMGRAASATGRGARAAGEGYLGITTGVGREVIDVAAAGAKLHPEFKPAMRGATTYEDVLDKVHDSIGKLVERRRDNYRAQLAQIPQSVVIDLKPIQQEMADALKRFNITVSGNDLDFSRSALRHSPQEMAKVRAAFEDVANWGTRPGDANPLGVDILKQGLNEMVATAPGRGDAIVKAVHDRTRTLLEQNVPGYKQLTGDYATASKFLDEVNAELSVGANAKPGAGIRKLTSSLNQRSDYRRHLIETLDISFGTDIKGAIAGLEMSTMTPRGLAGRIAVIGGSGLFLKLNDYVSNPAQLMAALTGAATFSPRLVGETLAGIASVRQSAVGQFAGEVGRTARRVVFNPKTYRFVREGMTAEEQRKESTAEMHSYLTGGGVGGSAYGQPAPTNAGTSTIPPPPDVMKTRKHTVDMTPEELVPPSLWFDSLDHKMTTDSSGVLPREKSKAREGSPKFTKVTKLRNAPDEGGTYVPSANALTLGSGITGKPSEHEQVLPHELLGHAVWDKTLPDTVKQQWKHIHKQNVKRLNDTDHEYLVHPAFETYGDDPGHSFAELAGQYVGYPEQLKADDPRIYAWFKSVFGREFITRTKEEGSNPSATLPYYLAGQNPQPKPPPSIPPPPK